MATYICLLATYLGALIFGTAVIAPVAVGSLPRIRQVTFCGDIG